MLAQIVRAALGFLSFTIRTKVVRGMHDLQITRDKAVHQQRWSSLNLRKYKRKAPIRRLVWKTCRRAPYRRNG